ncbi:MAG TPA: response regulator [Rhodothermales bacterium]|nr:response regulator [Rhodothermales bacterium]
MSDTQDARILIVDDEAALMKALCDTLRERGYDTLGCTSGKTALAALRESRFDLLLADLMMPDTDGISLLKAATEVDPDLVGIIMTGQGTIDTAVEAMKSGALDYILKPFKLSAILPVLNRALGVRQLRVENTALEQRVRQRTAELEAANKELEAFSYSVSHDLRAPLRTMASFSDMLMEDFAAELPPDARHLLDRIVSNAQKMGRLIDDLLRFSRLNQQPLSKQPVHTTTLVHEVLEELRRERDGRTVDVEVGELPDCFCDPSLLRQVFANLLSNAFKFTRQRENGKIEVGSHRLDGEDVYYVRDNGAGFDMQYAGKLFGVFQRLHSASEFEGTGIGLSIVNRIIQRHGGRIWAEAAVDQGATLYFSLPSAPVPLSPQDGQE